MIQLLDRNRTMKTRLMIQQLEPQAYKAMFELENYLANSTLDIKLIELIRLRVSQINGCAYCIEMHSKAALEKEIATNKLFALCAWKESPLFSSSEKAALCLAEEITLISINGVSDKTFEKVSNYLSENEIAQLIMLISTINVWNRIAISTHMFHTE